MFDNPSYTPSRRQPVCYHEYHSMTYDAYYHDDFDGRASTAVLLNFFEQRGDTFKNFIPVDYTIEPQWRREDFFLRRNPFLKSKNPVTVVDFRYHPAAAFWYDHHETSFITPDWRRRFRKTRTFDWDPKRWSCCSLIVGSLKKHWGYRPAAHIRELARWLDVIDGGNYGSARQTIEFKEPALQLNTFIGYKKRQGQALGWLIRRLSTEPMAEITKDPRVKKTVAFLRQRMQRQLAAYRKHSHNGGRVASIDLSVAGVPDVRFGLYHLYPKILYAITIKPRHGSVHITVGGNPWRRSRLKTDISQLLKKYGGGGHKYVGGVETPDIDTARRVVEKISDHLQVYG